MGAVLALLAAATAPCALPPGWDAVAARKTPYVIFDEVHGTRQSPEFVGNVICALARQKKRLLLALEISSSEDADLQAAWQLPTDRVAPALIETVRDWGADYAGGPMSQATLDMLVRLHRQKTEGGRIDIVAFNGARDAAQADKLKAKPDQGPHEAAQAENIREAAARGRYDTVIVLVGGTHARKLPVEHNGVSFDPMAMQLAPAKRITTLIIGHAGGTAFSCHLRSGFVSVRGQPVTKADVECKSRATARETDLAGPPRIELGDQSPVVRNGGYDGVFWVGPIESAQAAVARTKDVAK